MKHRPDEKKPAAIEPGDDLSMRDTLPDPGSYQSNHATTGTGGDDERGDADDAKVKGQSRG